MKPKLEYNYYEKTYTEDEIIDMFGADVLEKLDDQDCDFDGNDWVSDPITVKALVRGTAIDDVHEETDISLYAIYKEPKGLKQAQEDGDIDKLNWEIESYHLFD